MPDSRCVDSISARTRTCHPGCFVFLAIPAFEVFCTRPGPAPIPPPVVHSAAPHLIRRRREAPGPRLQTHTQSPAPSPSPKSGVHSLLFPPEETAPIIFFAQTSLPPDVSKLPSSIVFSFLRSPNMPSQAGPRAERGHIATATGEKIRRKLLRVVVPILRMQS